MKILVAVAAGIALIALVALVPVIDVLRRVSLQIVTMPIQSQGIISHDALVECNP